jgi:hypothetical protein
MLRIRCEPSESTQNSLRTIRIHSKSTANTRRSTQNRGAMRRTHSEHTVNQLLMLRIHSRSENPSGSRKKPTANARIHSKSSTYRHTHTENPLRHHSESHQVATWNIRKQLGNHSESIIYYCDTQKEHYSERSESTQNPTQYQLKARELGSAPNPLRNQL